MFDLHMHTTLSDGALSVEDLVTRLREANVTCFSITDHNHSKAYESLKADGMNVICGVELATSYEGRIVEILGYHVTPDIINTWFDEFYSEENLKKNETHLFNDLKECARKEGYDIPKTLEMPEIVKGISKKTIFYYLSENVDAFEFETFKAFFRKGLSNPSSPWFVDEGRFYPTPQETIDLIHSAGGIAILAHPHEYGFENVVTLFEYCQNLGIDGIESFHPSASMIQSIAIANYCVEHQLKSSGGSDFHRDARGIPHGVHAHPMILEKECFDWFRKEME